MWLHNLKLQNNWVRVDGWTPALFLCVQTTDRMGANSIAPPSQCQSKWFLPITAPVPTWSEWGHGHRASRLLTGKYLCVGDLRWAQNMTTEEETKKGTWRAKIRKTRWDVRVERERCHQRRFGSTASWCFNLQSNYSISLIMYVKRFLHVRAYWR